MTAATRYGWRPRAPAPADYAGSTLRTGPWAIAVMTIIYVELLRWVYRTAIAPAFSYLRYTYRDPDPMYYALALAMVVALAMLLPRRITQPSHFVSWVVLVVAVAPSIVVPQYSEVLSGPDAFEVAVWVALSFLPVAAFGTRRLVRDMLPRLVVSPPAFWITISVVAAFVYAYVIASVGVTFDLPSINDVYGVRDEFKQAEIGAGLLSYATPLIANVINPLIITKGLFARSWLWVVAGVLGQLFIYSFTGYRSAILSPVALLGAYLLVRRTRRASVLVLAGVVVLTVTMWVLDVITAGNDFTSLLVRRFLITPGLLTAGYVYVFADIPKAEFSHSFLSSFQDYPYSREPPLLVGELFFGNASTNANANLMADGYANLGFPGMLLECLVLMVVLWFVDDASRGLPVGVPAMVLLMPTLSLVDSGLFTTLLTHAFGAAILVCLLAPRPEQPADPVSRPSDAAAASSVRVSTPSLRPVRRRHPRSSSRAGRPAAAPAASPATAPTRENERP